MDHRIITLYDSLKRITPITPLLFSVKEAEMKSCTSFYTRHGETTKSTRERGNRKRKLSVRTTELT